MANNIKYRQIKAFCLAAQEGSFIGGARLLHVTQPSFTALIKGLEDDLGIPLFERTTRTCRLTAQGEGLYETLSRVLTDLEEAYQHAKDEGKGLRGRLSIAALPSLSVGFLAKTVAAFHERYPSVQIYMSELNSDEVIEAVRTNRVEIGVGRAPVDKELDFVPLFSDQLLVAGAPDHPVFAETHIEWPSLAEHELCMIGGGATAQEMAFVSRGKVQPVEVTHLATAASMARFGMLLAVIPSSATNALNTEGLRFEPIRGHGATRQLGAIYKRRRRLTSGARHFVELMGEMAALP